MTSSARSKVEKSISRFVKKLWLIFIKCGFIVTIVLGILSIILLQANLAIIYSVESKIAVYAAFFIVIALIIFGWLGFLLTYDEATKCVRERYKGALQEACETERYYHIWSDMAKEIEEEERRILKGLNPLLLAITIIIGVLNIAYILATYPKPHPFYPLPALAILSIFLAAAYLHIIKREKTFG